MPATALSLLTGENSVIYVTKMMVRVSQRLILPLLVLLTTAAAVNAQPHAPTVTMSISLPDGRIQELSAKESALVSVMSDGTEYGFKPTIHDSKPWTRVTVTIFKMATTAAPTELLGRVELKTGGPAVASKTDPSFAIAVTKVTDPEGR